MGTAETVGGRIRLARKRAGLKGTELAAHVGVRPHTLWRYDRIKPSAEALYGIADACGTTMEWLLMGVGDPPAKPKSLDRTGSD